MKPLKTLFGVALTALCATTFAQWQWIDKDGRKVYSDRGPPVDIPEKNIVKRPGTRTPALPTSVQPAGGAGDGSAAASAPALLAGVPKANADKDLEAKKKLAADAEAAKKKAEEERIAKAKNENCARAKQAKATMDSGMRMGRVNAAGEREIMDDAARAAEGKRIAGIMATECN